MPVFLDFVVPVNTSPVSVELVVGWSQCDKTELAERSGLQIEQRIKRRFDCTEVFLQIIIIFSIMERRAIITGVLGAGSIPVLIGGYQLWNTEDATCSDPNLQNPISYQQEEIVLSQEEINTSKLESYYNQPGADLITSEEDLEAMGLSSAISLNFETEFGILVVIGGGDLKDAHIMGVDRKEPSQLIVYTCYELRSHDDNDVKIIKLLTISHEGDAPEKVSYETSSVEP